jgi:transcriptional regulator with XRE-family HTH domain
VNHEELKRILKENNLKLKDFADLINTSYGTVTKWGKDGRYIPHWVESWLKLYTENQKLKESKEDNGDYEKYKALAKALQGVISKEK